jgi:phosphate-selective porin OprO/OprP
MKSLTRKRFALALLACSTLPLAAENIDDLKNQIHDLDQKLKILERRLELEKDSTAEKASMAPVLSAGANGFSFRSADTNFLLKIRGYVQADGRFFFENKGNGIHDTFLLRRVRPIIEGTVYEKYDYRLMLDFANGITSSTNNNAFVQDAYVNARFLPELQLQVGKFKEPVGLERLQSGANLTFVERAYPTQLVPNRDVGIQLHGTLWNAVDYAVAGFNGVADGGSGDYDTDDSGKDFAARIFAHPFSEGSNQALKGLGFGVAGTWGEQEGPLRSFVSPGQQKFFGYRSDAGTNIVAGGGHWRLVPQAYYYYGPFGILGEYAISSQEIKREAGKTANRATVENTAWQVAASYILTGEENSFKPLVPRRPFNFRGEGWGAWEIAARVSQLELDSAVFPLYADPSRSAERAISYGIGLNWYLNKNVKVNLNYEHTDFDGGAKSVVTASGEDVLFSRVQFAF